MSLAGKGDLSRSFNPGLGLHVDMVESRSDDALILEGILVFLTPSVQPTHQVGNGVDRARHLHLLIGLSDPFSHPCKLDELH